MLRFHCIHTNPTHAVYTSALIGRHLFSNEEFALKEPLTPNTTNSHRLSAGRPMQPSVAAVVTAGPDLSPQHAGFTASYLRLII